MNFLYSAVYFMKSLVTNAKLSLSFYFPLVLLSFSLVESFQPLIDFYDLK